MLKVFLILFNLFFVFVINLYCQDIGRMETDRPDQTESPFIVRNGYFQIESGFNKNYISKQYEYYFPTTLIKYGLKNKIELRYVFLINNSSKQIRFKNEAIAFKYFLFDQKRVLPKTSVIVHYHLGDLKRDLTDLNRSPHSIGDIVFTSQNQLNNQLSIGYNYGIEFHNDGKHEGIIRIAPGVNFGKNMYAYAEIFGRVPLKKYEDVWLDGGFAYYLNQDVKIDISGGKSIKQKQDYYLAVGISHRFKTFRKGG